jgi:hypothetical protein
MADSGFVIATSNPPQLVRYSESGAQVGEPIDLMGEPVAVTRTPGHILVATRGRDGVMVFETKRLRLADSVILDPTTVVPPYRSVNAPRRSGDIQSVAVYNSGLWVTTGDRDGELTVLRYRQNEGKWDVPTFTADTADLARRRMVFGCAGSTAISGACAPAASHRSSTISSAFVAIDRFDGKDRRSYGAPRRRLGATQEPAAAGRATTSSGRSTPTHRRSARAHRGRSHPTGRRGRPRTICSSATRQRHRRAEHDGSTT